MNCVKCGAAKTPDVEEHMLSADDVVTDGEMLKQAEAGPNWVCEYCGGQERNTKGECGQCGGKKPEDLIPKAKIRSYQGEVNREPLLDDIRPWWASPKAFKNSIKSDPGRSIVVCSILVAASFFAVFLVWLFTPKHIDAKVENIHWSYTANLREQKIQHDAEWGRPGNKGFYEEPAFNISCDNRYYGTESCNPHDCNPHTVSYSCNCTSYQCNCSTSCTNQKNGYSSCTKSCSTCSKCSTCYKTEYSTCYEQCPVYRDWCQYSYYEWPITKTQSTSGDDQKVYWPSLSADGSLQRLQRTETYEVGFSCPDDKYKYEPEDLLNFRRFNIGDLWRLQVGKIRTHNIESLERLKAEKE
jgi:hypothetical protein